MNIFQNGYFHFHIFIIIKKMKVFFFFSFFLLLLSSLLQFSFPFLPFPLVRCHHLFSPHPTTIFIFLLLFLLIMIMINTIIVAIVTISTIIIVIIIIIIKCFPIRKEETSNKYIITYYLVSNNLTWLPSLTTADNIIFKPLIDTGFLVQMLSFDLN